MLLWSGLALGMLAACQVLPAAPPADKTADKDAAKRKAASDKTSARTTNGKATFAPLPSGGLPPGKTVPRPGVPALPPLTGPGNQNTPPTLPYGPPLPPVPTLSRRAHLVGGVTPALQSQAARVDIELGIVVGTLPTLWRGTDYNMPVQDAGSAASNSGTSPVVSNPVSDTRRDKQLAGLIKTSGAKLARIDPFVLPGVVTLDSNDSKGTPIVHWESVDALLNQAAQHGEEVIFTLHPPAAWTSSAANTLIATTLRRYGPGSSAPLGSTVSIVRWELACVAASAPGRYPTFARLARVLAPGAPLGLNILNTASSEVTEGIRQTAAICAQDKLPLNSVAWKLPNNGNTSDAEKSIRLTRRTLAQFPSLKSTLLIPTLPAFRADAVTDDAPAVANLTALGARLMQAAPQVAVNPLIGILAEERLVYGAATGSSEDIVSAGEASHNELGDKPTWSEMGQMLALLNRMAGTRVKVQIASAGIGCLAVRGQKQLLVLLWREPQPTDPNLRHNADTTTLLTMTRLHHLPAEMTGSIHIARFEPGGLPAALVTQDPMKPTGAGETPPGPVAVADVPEDSRFLPDELEVPTLLAPGSACLLEITPAAKEQLTGSGSGREALEWTLETDAANLHGGDTLNLILSAHNKSPQPRKVDVALTASLPDVLPQAVTKASLGLVPPNGIRAFRFALHTPIVGENTTAAVNILVNNTHSLSLTVPILPALEATLDTARADVELAAGTANVRARLVNRTQHALKLRLRAVGALGTTLTLLPGSVPQFAGVALPSPEHAAGVYAVALRVESIENQVRLLRTLHPLVGVPFLCPYVATRPTIDGDLSKWAAGELLGMGQAEQAHGKPWRGPTDLSAYAYTGWDAHYFYFACAVTDDVFFQPYSVAEMEQGDCVQFALANVGQPSPSGNGSLHDTKHNGADYWKFGMALLPETGKSSGQKSGKEIGKVIGKESSNPKAVQERAGSVKPTLVWFPGTDGTGKVVPPVAVKGAQIAIRREGARTYYEAAIPWSALRTGPPQAGERIRLSIVVHDNDNDGQGQGYVEWGGSLIGKTNPLRFPALRLTK